MLNILQQEYTTFEKNMLTYIIFGFNNDIEIYCIRQASYDMSEKFFHKLLKTNGNIKFHSNSSLHFECCMCLTDDCWDSDSEDDNSYFLFSTSDYKYTICGDCYDKFKIYKFYIFDNTTSLCKGIDNSKFVAFYNDNMSYCVLINDRSSYYFEKYNDIKDEVIKNEYIKRYTYFIRLAISRFDLVTDIKTLILSCIFQIYK